MARSVRLLAVSVVLGIVLVLAFLPVGIVGQNQPGLFASLASPNVAHALIRWRVISPSISEPISLFGNDRVGIATIPIACDPDDILRVRVAITQTLEGGTLAVGDGLAQTRCTGEVQTVNPVVTPRTPARFTPGTADACATASTFNPITDTIGLTDSRSWCQQVVLGTDVIIE